jgi:hypothetical protein
MLSQKKTGTTNKGGKSCRATSSPRREGFYRWWRWAILFEKSRSRNRMDDGGQRLGRGAYIWTDHDWENIGKLYYYTLNDK